MVLAESGIAESLREHKDKSLKIHYLVHKRDIYCDTQSGVDMLSSLPTCIAVPKDVRYILKELYTERAVACSLNELRMEVYLRFMTKCKVGGGNLCATLFAGEKAVIAAVVSENPTFLEFCADAQIFKFYVLNNFICTVQMLNMCLISYNQKDFSESLAECAKNARGQWPCCYMPHSDEGLDFKDSHQDQGLKLQQLDSTGAASKQIDGVQKESWNAVGDVIGHIATENTHIEHDMSPSRLQGTCKVDSLRNGDDTVVSHHNQGHDTFGKEVHASVHVQEQYAFSDDIVHEPHGGNSTISKNGMEVNSEQICSPQETCIKGNEIPTINDENLVQDTVSTRDVSLIANGKSTSPALG